MPDGGEAWHGLGFHPSTHHVQGADTKVPTEPWGSWVKALQVLPEGEEPSKLCFSTTALVNIISNNSPSWPLYLNKQEYSLKNEIESRLQHQCAPLLLRFCVFSYPDKNSNFKYISLYIISWVITVCAAHIHSWKCRKEFSEQTMRRAF